MKKSVLLISVLLFGCLLFSFAANNNGSTEISTNDTLGYLPANCDAPVLFQIDSQEPCPIFNVNENTGALSFKRKRNGVDGLCGNVNGKDNESNNQVYVNYSVTNADGVRRRHFIIIDLEEEE